MTISSEIRKAGPFTGAGTTDTFAFAFKIFDDSDLLVVKRETATGTETTLTLTTDYTVDLNFDQNSNPGGDVVLVAGNLPSGYTLVITSDIDNLQPMDIVNQGRYYPQVIEDNADRQCIQIQQLQEELNRCAKLDVSTDLTSLAIEEPVGNSWLRYSADGTTIINGDISNFAELVTYENLNANGDVGQSAGQVCAGDDERLNYFSDSSTVLTMNDAYDELSLQKQTKLNLYNQNNGKKYTLRNNAGVGGNQLTILDDAGSSKATFLESGDVEFAEKMAIGSTSVDASYHLKVAGNVLIDAELTANGNVFLNSDVTIGAGGTLNVPDIDSTNVEADKITVTGAESPRFISEGDPDIDPDAFTFTSGYDYDGGATDRAVQQAFHPYTPLDGGGGSYVWPVLYTGIKTTSGGIDGFYISPEKLVPGSEPRGGFFTGNNQIRITNDSNLDDSLTSIGAVSGTQYLSFSDTNIATPTDNLSIYHGPSGGKGEIYFRDGNGTKAINIALSQINIYTPRTAFGTDDTNGQDIIITPSTGAGVSNTINATSRGTGVTEDLIINVGSNANQLRLTTDDRVGIGVDPESGVGVQLQNENTYQLRIGTATDSDKFEFLNTGNLFLNSGELHAGGFGATVISGTGDSWFSGGNVGIGTNTFETWASIYTALKIGGNAYVSANTASGASGNLNLSQNLYNSTTGWKAISTDECSLYYQNAGQHIFYSSGVTSAGVSPSLSLGMLIDSSGKIGVGITNPSSYSADANNLVVGSLSGNNGVTILASTSGYSSLYFADGTGASAYRGKIQYSHSADKYYMGTQGRSTDFVIDSSGNVGISTTTPSTSLDVNGPIRCGQYTVATVPSASTSGSGSQIYVSDETGGAVIAFSDGTNWRRVTDRAIIS